MSWFKLEHKPLESDPEKQSRVPEGLWIRCEDCKEMMFAKAVNENAGVCPKCNYHFPQPARKRLEAIFDDGRFDELDVAIGPADPLGFKDSKSYKDRIKASQAKTGTKDALITAWGRVGGQPLIACCMNFDFMGGSMGSVVGEKITRGAELALQRKIPLMVICASGGARMQEGAVSLMQMAKISGALGRMHEAGIPYLALLTDPTTGGVTASYAMLGDLNIAEPKALIGFAGPRVIAQTIRQTLPEGFQKSEFLLEKGMVDIIASRFELRDLVARLLKYFSAPGYAG
jgi:acetyl-CoA carboxylase carboxyl transferase subunit beta